MIIFKILYSHISGSLVGIAYTCDERTFVSFKTAHKAVSGWKYLPSSINNQDKITRSIGELLLLIYISGREELWDFDEREAVSLHRLFFFKYDFCLLRNVNESLSICQILSPRAQMLSVYSLFLSLYFVMWYRIMFNKISALSKHNSSLFSPYMPSVFQKSACIITL